MYINYGSMILSVWKFWWLELAVEAKFNVELNGMGLVSEGDIGWYY